MALQTIPAVRTLWSSIRSIIQAMFNELYPVQVVYSAAIPFKNLFTDMATHAMIANVAFTVDTSGAIDNAKTELLLTNSTSYSISFTGISVIGVPDNTLAYTFLCFERKRGIYTVSILNFD